MSEVSIKVPFLDLRAANAELSPEIEEALLTSVRSGQYVGGDAVTAFEDSFARYVNSDHCIGVANGLDALALSLRVLGVKSGDEVIVPSNTFIATWLAVTQCGAIPIPVEPCFDTCNIDPRLIEAKITKRTTAIIPVHLYGEPADLDEIIAIAKAHNIYVVEDAAQAHGSRYKGRKIGSHSDLVAWSFYPGKNLGALGDGGAITTNNEKLAERLRVLRNYGSKERYVHTELGLNSRLDAVQAAVLQVKLRCLDEWNQRRAAVAEFYSEALKNLPVILPSTRAYNDPVWHLYCIRLEDREAFRESMSAMGVETLIHYPTPPHAQDAYRFLDLGVDSLPIAEAMASQLVSLPIGPTVSEMQMKYVVDCVQSYFYRSIVG